MSVALDLSTPTLAPAPGARRTRVVTRKPARSRTELSAQRNLAPDLGAQHNIAGPLAPWWKLVPRRYGHVFHAMCSYMGMFPPSLPRYFIEQYSKPGDLVLDPFSGRGTTALEACLRGRVGVGLDLNPLAALLSEAKVDPPTHAEALARLHEIRSSYRRSAVTEKAPPEIAMLFDGRRTLPQLMHLRACLQGSSKREDRFLLAALVGILHGNHPRNPMDSRCLSVSMPNTFSMSPGYLKKYIHQNGLKKYPLDAFEKLAQRLEHLYAQPLAPTRGRAIHADALALHEHVAPKSAKLIVTSPPYLNVVRYGKFNWIRLWMMGESVQNVDASLTDRTRTNLEVERTDRQLGLSDRLGFRRYCAFLRDAVIECARALSDDGVCIMTIGDVENGEHDKRLALDAWRAIADEVPLELHSVIEDRLWTENKVSRIWGENKGRATRVERVLVLTRKGCPLPRANFTDPSEIVLQMSRETPGAMRSIPGIDHDPRAAV
ncbi:MAG: DNA methyltransferase [Deltaproteobacteria bacterium]|nr:DNA methyltransferase [Deltaproteobacteria bacterium]